MREIYSVPAHRVRHKEYLALDPDAVVRMAGGSATVNNCFGMLDGAKTLIGSGLLT